MIQHLLHNFEDAELVGWEGPGWYFWDETEAYCYGPYRTKQEAEVREEFYFDWLKTGDVHQK